MNEIRTRVKHKRDTSANWESRNPVLLNGEKIIVDTANGEVREKTGDGVKTYTQLPFDDKALRNLIANKTRLDRANATLSASAWTGASAPYTQSILISGITTSSVGNIGIADSATTAQVEAARDAMLRKTGQGNGSITIVADGDKPAVDIPVTVMFSS